MTNDIFIPIDYTQKNLIKDLLGLPKNDPKPNIEGQPLVGNGYAVQSLESQTDECPKIVVEMSPSAFRSAANYLNKATGFCNDDWGAKTRAKKMSSITKVIYNPPATIVWFGDGDKIVSKTEDEFDWITGLAICVLKKRMGRKEYNRLQPYFFEGEKPLWDVLVRMNCPNGEWEKIKKEWKK